MVTVPSLPEFDNISNAYYVRIILTVKADIIAQDIMFAPSGGLSSPYSLQNQ